ncbi:type VII secretion-associated protein [Mycobacterium sp.]|uniref:type VII secretion-associated protein n=1 Tax=Mycobacterium sp. TaxID=1785 RepID=UPI003F99286B
MSTHRTVIEVGPGTIRRLCCGTGTVVDAEMCAAALDAIDDRVALVDGSPVAVDSLWRTVLRSLDCGSGDGLTVVHPSWWPPSRVGVVTAAAPGPNQLEAHPRSWLLTQAWSDTGPDATVVVEIAGRLVAVAAAEVVAVPRTMQPPTVADQVASLIAATTRAVVLIDAPDTVAGAAALATLIADAVRDGGAQTVTEIKDARLRQLARRASQLRSDSDKPRSAAGARGSRSRARGLAWLAAAGVVVVAAVPAVGALATMGRHGVPAVHTTPTTFLVEGRVALTVPANWPTQRVVGGPGSARVQVTSPSDPEVALHVTQSPVAGETLSGTAERLKRALDAEPAGVFIDFNPYGTSAGRPAVTYLEVRTGHQVRWTVLLEGVVRISVGCQSRPGGEDAVRDVCEQAVRSAHAVE